MSRLASSLESAGWPLLLVVLKPLGAVTFWVVGTMPGNCGDSPFGDGLAALLFLTKSLEAKLAKRPKSSMT